MACERDSQEIFTSLSTKFSQLLYGRTEGDRTLIDKTLDDLNALDYRYPIIANNSRAVLLINQLCSLVPPDDSDLVAKCCILVANLMNKQRILVEGRTLILLVEWTMQALKQASDSNLVDILLTLDILIRKSTDCINSLLPIIVAANSPVLDLASKQGPIEVVMLAVQCLEACCKQPESTKKSDDKDITKYHEQCASIFCHYLFAEKHPKSNYLKHLKLLISCLKGAQSVAVQNEVFLERELEKLLGITKSYMVLGLNGFQFVAPRKVMPSPMSVPEPTPNRNREKKGGKVTRQRKQRPSGSHKKDVRRSAEIEYHDFSRGYVPASSNSEYYDAPNQHSTGTQNKIKTSDSDFSDSEAGRSAQTSMMEGRVRQASLALLLSICKLTDRRTMFSYWSSFIPEAQLSTGSHSLTNCVLKDPSPRGRMAALNVLLALLGTSKVYLSQAEYSERSTSFTPFSVTLGSIIKELHHCLCLALNENSYPVLTQALKCIAALVQATPYHRLSPGLTNKVIRNVKSFISHKDATVQVAALIVLGCILASEPVVKETREALLRNVDPKPPKTERAKVDDDFEYAGFSSSEEEETDSLNAGDESDVPWLLQRCLKNLNEDSVPAPVKLESLQVISAMCRNYFGALVLPYLSRVMKAVEISLVEKSIDVRLHAGRTVDFVGQAMNQHFIKVEESRKADLDQGLIFWQTLLDGPLIELMQCEQYPTLRTIGCDCLGSIGSVVFELLPREKQLLCITLLFTCSRDEDNGVKGSAVRALAVSVLYPSLREDPGFIMDTAEAVHRTLTDENATLRVKSSWSMGNLSDAFVLNKNDNIVACDDLPDSLLLSLIRDAIRNCDDNDKIRSNGVRALGNFLQVVDDRLIETDDFHGVVVKAVQSLVSCSTTGSNMKVRWNACYALGNVLRNMALYTRSGAWLSSVFGALGELVVGFKNFKVRINAALALAACPTRDLYGIHYTFTWNCLLKALENSENMEDFSEYKHRDHLIDQICLSLGHLVTLLTVEDITSWKDTFSASALKMQVQRVYDRVLPEKSSILFAAREHLFSLEGLTVEQQEVISDLKEVYHNEFIS